MGTDDPINLGLAGKSKNLSSLLAEFFVLPCPIRAAYALAPISSYPCSSG
jgi:hypothetical protein